MFDVAPKTVAIISHAWNDDLTGGAFKVATDFARYLASCGHRVHYLCGADRGSNHAELVDDVAVWRYEYPKSSGPGALRSHISGMAGLFRQACQEQEFAAVSGHSPLQYYAVARKRQVCPGARFTFSVHSPFVDELQSAGRASLPVRFIARMIDGRCIKHSDHVTTYSAYTMNRMTQLYGPTAAAKMSVRSAWVDVHRFQPATNKNEVRRRLAGPWLPDVPTLVSVRRLERRMGLDHLITAVKQVKEAGHTLRLLIGGSGSMEAELRNQIESLGLQQTVFLLGRVPDEQLVDTYAAADCFVLPTKSLECFGLITLESYACGVPVIATPVAAIPEIVRHHDPSWLTAGIESTEIAATILKFLGDELAHDSASLRAIAESYSQEKRAGDLAAVVFGNAVTANVSTSCEANG